MSATSAGSRIVFIVVGNAVGGLLTGWYINRTGCYKSVIYVATILGIICYALVLIRWHGSSSLLDSSYLILGGLGMGSTQSTTFVHLVAALDAKDLAVAGTTWFLCQSAGMLIAANVFNMVHNLALTSMLGSALEGVADKSKVIYLSFPIVSIWYLLTMHLRLSMVFPRALNTSKLFLPTCARLSRKLWSRLSFLQMVRYLYSNDYLQLVFMALTEITAIALGCGIAAMMMALFVRERRLDKN